MRRKAIGYIFVAMGLLMFGFVILRFFSSRNSVVSPVPDDGGIKVIYR